MLDQSPISIIARICQNHFDAVRDDGLADDDVAAADKELAAKAHETWARPVQSFDDVLLRALLAREFADRDEIGNIAPPRNDSDRAIIELIEGVMALARRHGVDA